jgi:hypothetical protein
MLPWMMTGRLLVRYPGAFMIKLRRVEKYACAAILGFDASLTSQKMNRKKLCNIKDIIFLPNPVPVSCQLVFPDLILTASKIGLLVGNGQLQADTVKPIAEIELMPDGIHEVHMHIQQDDFKRLKKRRFIFAPCDLAFDTSWGQHQFRTWIAEVIGIDLQRHLQHRFDEDPRFKNYYLFYPVYRHHSLVSIETDPEFTPSSLAKSLKKIALPNRHLYISRVRIYLILPHLIVCSIPTRDRYGLSE